MFVYVVLTDTGGVYVFGDATDAQRFADAHASEGPYAEPVISDREAVEGLIDSADV